MSLSNYTFKTLTDKLRSIPLLGEIGAQSILKQIPFFSEVNDSTLEEISNSVLISEFYRKDVICRNGMFNERLHIILSGNVKAIIHTENDPKYELFKLGPGDFFGEEILFSDEPRSNTILAAEDTITISMSKDILQRLVIESQNLKSLMDKQYVNRKLSSDLRRIPIFTPLNDDLFSEILNRVELIALPKGTVVFSEGDDGDAFYLIRKGKVNVSRIIANKKKLIAILGEDQFFGEISLLSNEPRNATLKVSESAEFAKISRKAFLKIVEKDKGLKNELQKIIEERLKDKDALLKSPNLAIVTRKLLDLNKDLNKHLDIIHQSTVETDTGSALLATFPGARYPYVYPRDSACASRFLYKLAISSLKSGKIAFRLLHDTAGFVLGCQRKDGLWGQRYGIKGEDKSIYVQEDNIAHGVTILCRYLIAAKYNGITSKRLEQILKAIRKGAKYARKNYYRNEIHLYYSTTSIHESAIEKGYSIWVNYAYLLMLRLIERVGREYGVSRKFQEELELKDGLEATIEIAFATSGRLVRKIKSNGELDFRTDVTLMSPFVFGTGMDIEYFEDNEKFINTIKFVEETLWDSELGMLQRYLPYIEDPHIHVHAGNGPWIQYTAILAQYHFYKGNIKKGNEILNLIDSYSSKEGYHSEHLTTPERFQEFMKLEWVTGRDFNKELLDPDILIPNISCDFIVEELTHMKKAYYDIVSECQQIGNKGYINFVNPLMWSHAEYGMALVMKTEQELEGMKKHEVYAESV